MTDRLMFLFATILVMLISGCADIPTNQPHDPEFANLVAAATQTAVSNIRAQTETPKAATVQAVQTESAHYATATAIAIFAAEQATQSAYATETAVIVTETAMYAPISLVQTSDAQAVLMQRVNAGSTATAVAIQSEIANNAKAIERWDFFWQMFTWAIGGLLLAGIVALLGTALRAWKPVEAIYDDGGSVIGVDKRHYQQITQRRPSRAVVIENQTNDEIGLPQNNMQASKPVKFNSSRGNQVINVPDSNPDINPLAWYSLAHAVLVDEVTFSKDAITAETHISQPVYLAMYAELKAQKMVEGDTEKLQNSDCYEYLFNKLNEEDRRWVRIPHPSGKEPDLGDSN